MGTDPLSQFLQNSRPLPQDAVPINYRIQKAPEPQPSGGILDLFDPIGALRKRLQGTPEMEEVMKVIDQNGGDEKTAFYNECKKRNVDPNTIFSNPLFKRFFGNMNP